MKAYYRNASPDTLMDDEPGRWAFRDWCRRAQIPRAIMREVLKLNPKTLGEAKEACRYVKDLKKEAEDGNDRAD